jgi:hypothetical protein
MPTTLRIVVPVGEHLTPRGDPFYAIEKLHSAVHTLATGHGRIRDRLFDAFLEIAAVSDDDIPQPLRPLWREIRGGLTCKPAKRPGEGAINATLRGMRKEKAEQTASRICELATKLETQLDQDEGQ